MKLYEFELKENRIIVSEYEVKETQKLYIVQKTDNNKSYIQYNYLTKVPKDIVDNETVITKYNDHYYYSVNNDISKVKQIFISHLENEIIPMLEENIEKAIAKKHKYEDMRNRLLAKSM